MNFSLRSSHKRKALQITVASCSEIGRVREQNEDALALSLSQKEGVDSSPVHAFIVFSSASG